MTIAPAERIAVGFARVLRGAGLSVPTSTVVAFAEALDAVGVTARGDVYWAARATLVRRPEDIALFDRAFAAYWEHAAPPGDPVEEPEPVSVTLAVDEGEGDDQPEQASASDDPTIELRFSTTEVLRHKDFAAYDAARAGRGPPADEPHAPGRRHATVDASATDNPPDRPSRPTPDRAGGAAQRG